MGSLVDPALIEHIIQNFFAAGCVVFRIGDRIVSSRILCDCSDGCRFGKVKFIDILIKISLCG